MRDHIESLLKEELSKVGAGGGLCALNVGGEIEIYSAGDITSEEHGRSFYIYSVSKSITAAAILMLEEQYELSLDENLATWNSKHLIPEGVTIRHLLNHTGGLSDYFSTREYQRAVYTEPMNPWSYEDLMRKGLERTPLFAPGEGWMYSNPAYGILKEIIEERSGQGYYDFIKVNVLEPLAMHETQPFDRLDHGVSLLGGADPKMNGDFRKIYHPDWIATGSFISTVSDVTKFYQGLFSGELLSFESLEKMKTTVLVPYPFESPREPRYGLGLMSFGNDPHGENYGHGGGGPGYSVYAKHVMNINGEQVTAVLVVNTTLPQTPFDGVHRVIDFLLTE